MKTVFKTLIIAAIACFAGCTQANFEPAEYSTGEKTESTITIAELKDRFIDKKWVFFGSDLIDSVSPLVINGIVVSTDVEGNIYKYIAIKEEEPGGQSIRISIDAAGLAAIYPLGQRVSVKLNGLYIGQYGQTAQIGIFGRHNTRISEPEQTAAIPFPLADKNIIPYGKPEPDAVVADTMTLAQILAADKDTLNYRLVHIKNAHFTGNGEYRNGAFVTLSDADKIFAPGTNGVNYPQTREISDGTASASIATSEFSVFAKHRLPAGTYSGGITAIVSWYMNDSRYSEPADCYQLTMRTLGDLDKGFDGYLKSVNYTRK